MYNQQTLRFFGKNVKYILIPNGKLTSAIIALYY